MCQFSGAELPPTLFNWLDERAEESGLDLESAAFWSELIDECCVGNAGGPLRRTLRR